MKLFPSDDKTCQTHACVPGVGTEHAECAPHRTNRGHPQGLEKQGDAGNHVVESRGAKAVPKLAFLDRGPHGTQL